MITIFFCNFNKSYIADQYYHQNPLTDVQLDRFISHQSGPGVKARVVLAPTAYDVTKKSTRWLFWKQTRTTLLLYSS